MKLFVILMLAGCAYAATAPQLVPGSEQAEHNAIEILKQSRPVHDVEGRNWFIQQGVNIVVNQAIALLRRIINGGSEAFGIPPLDPLTLDHFHLEVPSGIINLDLELEDVYVAGIGGFISHRNHLDIRTLLLELEISVPLLEIRSKYDLTGDLFWSIPLFGKGYAEFDVENFRFRAMVQLGQSDDGTAVIIQSINNISFEIPVLRSNLTGVIGGGDIDAIVNAIIEEVIMGYIHRFRGAIALIAAPTVTAVLNPFLHTLDTWRFLAPFV